MKQIRTLFLLAVCIVSLQAFCQETFTIGDLKYTIISSSSKVVSVSAMSTSISGSVIIPESVTYEGISYRVGVIADEGFSACNGMTSIAIPNSITTIGINAFYSCSGLTSISIPNSVVTIGGQAFAYCRGLTTIIIPNSVTNIGNSAFKNCSSIESVVMSNNITSISDYMFESCSSLKSVAIPYGVKNIGSRAFRECTALTSVTIPNSVISIDYQAFRGCTNLTTIAIPSSVTKIGTNAFWECNLSSVHISDLTAWCNIDFENNPLSYAHHLFLNGSEVKELVIPNGVMTIKKRAFSGCSNFISINIPNSVTKIEYGVFAGCENLKIVSIGNGIKTIEGRVFDSGSSIEDVYCYATNTPTTSDDAFQGCFIEYKKLHVPDESLAAYKNTSPWSEFGTIVGISGGSETQQCATPTISFGGKKLSFDCETEGVAYVTEIKDADIGTFYDDKITLSATYEISVYATKTGYINSEKATATLVWTNATFTDTTPLTDISNIPQTYGKPVLIQSNRGVVTIQGADDGTAISIYNTAGQMTGSSVSNNGKATVITDMNPGTIGIVKVGEKNIKIIIK